MKLQMLLPVVGGMALLGACHDRPQSTEQTTTTTTTTTSAIAASPVPVTVTASFDCAHALPGAEAAVCGNAQVAQLDVELARLYTVVDSAPAISDAERTTLRRLQDGWKQKRDACTETVDVAGCLTQAYTSRISDLRASYATAGADTAGISLGPISWRCPGKTELLTSTFVNGTSPVVYLHRDTNSVLLTQAASASGSRYAATTPDGAYEFWTKGSESTFTVPGAAAVTCTLADKTTV